MTTASSHGHWYPTAPALAQALVDARHQLHHAIQFCAAFGISYLSPADDDSHTNLQWDAERRALVSGTSAGALGEVAVGVHVPTLALVVTRDAHVVHTLPLHGHTIASAAEALRVLLGVEGLPADRFTLERHYTLPAHALAAGAAFDAPSPQLFEELAHWLGNASLELEQIVGMTPGAADVRLWPHHCDIATLVSFGGGRSSSVGLALGDSYYAEPYFYVNAYPSPSVRPSGAVGLAGDGVWHTHEWFGAVLPGSRVLGDTAAQRTQVRAFLDAALAACRGFGGS